MNEMKPEDVMRALAWYEVVGKNIGSVTIPYDELQAIAALLREKDAETKGLVDGWSKDQDRFEKVCAEKDAEIERLNIEIEALKIANEKMYQASQGIRVEAITEMEKRLEQIGTPLMHTYVVTRMDIKQVVKDMKEENGNG